MSYQNIVTAISASLQEQHISGGLTADEIAVEIIERQACMPDYLRFPIRLLTLMFDWFGLLSGGRRFQSKGAPARLAQLNSWKYSSVGACRNFVRFYESLFLLIALQEDAA
jgi:hypothetical protein